MHNFRIESKRMRYTLELFIEYFGPRYAELIDRVRHIQTLLGDVNDLVTATRLLKGHDDAVDVRKRFREGARKKFAKAHRYWKSEFGDEALERWVRYLQTQARSKSVEKTGT
jgi:CHAD domain-containing protein